MTLADLDDGVTDPKFLAWSEREISFSRKDQWCNNPYPGRFPLVLDPVIHNMRFEKVLIDGGSALNILFKNSLQELGISASALQPYEYPFWGILPGQSSQPLGQLTLVVQFGSKEHHRIEHVNFIVADFSTSYHAILGRPALAKFMAIPHYTYLVLKMPTPKGVLSLRANIPVAHACEKEGFQLSEAIDLSVRAAEVQQEAKRISNVDLEIPTKEAPRKHTKNKEVKEIELVPGDATKTTRIGNDLSDK
jgi:hypothetical protein